MTTDADRESSEASLGDGLGAKLGGTEVPKDDWSLKHSSPTKEKKPEVYYHS